MGGCWCGGCGAGRREFASSLVSAVPAAAVLCTRRGDGPPPPRGWTLVSILVRRRWRLGAPPVCVFAAAHAKGVTLAHTPIDGAATTPPYSSSRPPPPPPPFARPSECVRVRCPCGRVPPRPTRRAALSGRKPPNIAVKRARTRVARSAASYIPRRRRVSYTGYRSSGAAPPPFNRARSLAHTNEHPHTYTIHV